MQVTRNWQRALATGLLALLLSACGSLPKAPVGSGAKDAGKVALPAAGSGRGGYYKDDGPAENTPDNLMATPDAVPKVEPIALPTSRPYAVLGTTYKPITDGKAYTQRGLGTWYGKKFHGQKTASGERYDMFKMTAAHPTLPIPSYARVTNLANGKQIIVRINDRGPFHSTRIIDLSYTAALKLGYLSNGSGTLEVERLLPDEIARINSGKVSKNKVVVQENIEPEPKQTIAAAAPATPTAPVPAVVAMPLPPDGSSVVSRIAAVTDAPVAEKVVSSGAGNATTSLVSGVYLQFGAFSQIANAEAARDRLLPTWMSAHPPLEVIPSGALYRVTSGPFASRQEAESVARQTGASNGSKPVIVLR